jgi:molecular chaperone HtpG
MTDDEVKKYINQIAFSGAEDFLNTYKDKENVDQIIDIFYHQVYHLIKSYILV